MVQPEFVEAFMRAEGISMEEGEEEDNRMDYWTWLDEDEDAVLRGEVREETWE
jgi:hypothetical protein